MRVIRMEGTVAVCKTAQAQELDCPRQFPLRAVVVKKDSGQERHSCKCTLFVASENSKFMAAVDQLEQAKQHAGQRDAHQKARSIVNGEGCSQTQTQAPCGTSFAGSA